MFEFGRELKRLFGADAVNAPRDGLTGGDASLLEPPDSLSFARLRSALTRAFDRLETGFEFNARWGTVVRLTREGEDHARLEVTNSIGAQERTMEGTGLGSQLIEAFAMQLEGEAKVITTDTEYTLSLVFRIEEITPLPVEDRTFVVLTSAARDGARH